MKIGTDWFVKAKCPRPDGNVKNEEEHINRCSDCPYVIWQKPHSVAGFMASMCGVRVGSIGMAAQLDGLGERLTGIERFTKTNGTAEAKLFILKRIKSYLEQNGNGTIAGLNKIEMLEWIGELIDFCQKAEEKALDIRVWA